MVSPLSPTIVIKAQIHGFDVWIILEALKKHPVRNGTGCRIAVVIPMVFVHRNERQHINGRLKQKDFVRLAVPVKAVFGYAARYIPLE